MDVVREEATIVEHGGQHGRDGFGAHLVVVFMFKHL